MIRQQDSDRFLLSLFAPCRHRPALWVLFAFHYEIAKSCEVVSDKTIGLIRLQWWRDEIEKIYEGKPVCQHEVLEPLAQTIQVHDLPRGLFNKLIEAREFDLEGVAPATMEALLNYCEHTNAPLMKLALKILGEEGNDTAVVDISTHYALIGVIRAVPYMLKSHRILLPQDVLAHHKLSEQKLFDFKEKERVPKVVEYILNRYSAHRKYKSNDISSKFLKKANYMVRLYENQLKAVGYDVFDAKISLPVPFLSLRLWLNV